MVFFGILYVRSIRNFTELNNWLCKLFQTFIICSFIISTYLYIDDLLKGTILFHLISIFNA